MSCKADLKFEVTNFEIMENTLKNLRLEFIRKDEKISLKRNWNDIEITNDSIIYDSADLHLVNQIKVEYQKEFQVNDIALKGETYDIVENSNEIVITVR